ncbi:MAG: SH3 domain-containing protein [Clostridiales bacterium]|nr:SH3 domain-containing protein [Clostridiales bacterium]
MKKHALPLASAILLILLLIPVLAACSKDTDNADVVHPENDGVDNILIEESLFSEDDNLSQKTETGLGDVEPIASTNSQIIYFTTTNVNLREGSGTDFAKILTVPQGTAVEIMDFLDNNWLFEL